jgi:hypothetical protein
MASWYHVLLSGVCKVGLLVQFCISVIYLFDIHNSPKCYHLRHSPLYLLPPPHSPSYKSLCPSLLADATSAQSLKIMAVPYHLQPYFTHTIPSAMFINSLWYGLWLISCCITPVSIQLYAGMVWCAALCLTTFQ